MTAEPLAAPVEATVVAAKPAVTLNPPASGGQPLRDPLVDLSSWEKISQGAEARVWAGIFLGHQTVVKQRFSKKYRNPVLDFRLNTTRLKQEVRGLQKAHKVGVNVPSLYYVEVAAGCLYLERVQGGALKDALFGQALSEAERGGIAAAMGSQVALMHDNGLIHGDLTTSNFMLQGPDHALVCIDFGLSTQSTLAEDKAVDLYVMERAFSSAHPDIPGMFDQVLDAYKGASRMWSTTFNKFAEVRMRGRKRVMVG